MLMMMLMVVMVVEDTADGGDDKHGLGEDGELCQIRHWPVEEWDRTYFALLKRTNDSSVRLNS